MRYVFTIALIFTAVGQSAVAGPESCADKILEAASRAARGAWQFRPVLESLEPRDVPNFGFGLGHGAGGGIGYGFSASPLPHFPYSSSTSHSSSSSAGSASSRSPAVPPPLLPVSAVTAVTENANMVTLSWTAAPAPATSVALERSVSGGDFVPLATFPTTTTSFSDATVLPGVDYKYRLSDTDALSRVAYSPITEALTPAVAVKSLEGVSSAIAVGTGGGVTGLVQVYDSSTSGLLFSLVPFPGFQGPVHTTTAEVTGDGILDVIVAAGPGGGPNIRVFDGKNASLVANYFAYDPSFTGGVWVSTGDVDGDGKIDLVTGAGPGGGPHVRVLDPLTGAVKREFLAYEENFRGGVRIALGDIDGDGKADIITGTGFGGGPRVRVFSGATGGIIRDFFAYEPEVRSGVSVAVVDANGDGFLDIATGPGPGGGPRVQIFDGATGTTLQNFFAYDSSVRGGVEVASTERGTPLVTGTGPGGSSHIQTFDPSTGLPVDAFFAFDPAFIGGVYVGAGALP